MKLMAPAGYTDFICTAGACRHTCCAGWEIDIDSAALEAYQRMQGALGEKLRQVIVPAEDGSFSFALTAEERCPLLRPDGLCELICQLGPGALCQVCADHPRYRHFLSDRIEIGLGLCCEEATRQQLTRREPFRLTLLEDDGAQEPQDPEEATFLRWREEVFALATDRTLPLEERMAHLAAAAGMADERPVTAWAQFFLTLERLDEAWTALLTSLEGWNGKPAPLSAEASLPYEQLLCCLLYRHLTDALEDERLACHLRLVIVCWRLIRAVAAQHPEVGLPEVARLFSSEVEYSAENLALLLDAAEA